VTHLSKSTFEFLSPWYTKPELIELENQIIQFIKLAKPVACRYQLIESVDKKRVIPFIFIQLRSKKKRKTVNAHQVLNEIISCFGKHTLAASAVKCIADDLKKITEIKDFLSKLKIFTNNWSINIIDEVKAKQFLFLEKRKKKEKNELKNLLFDLKQSDWTLQEVIDSWNELLVQEVMET